MGRRTCRVIRRGRSWRVRYGKRWIITRKFQFRVGRTYRTVTRRGRFYSMRFKRRTVKFRFYRRRYFKFKGRRIFIRRSKRIGRRRYYKFKVKGVLISRRRRFRRRRRIRCKCTLLRWRIQIIWEPQRRRKQRKRHCYKDFASFPNLSRLFRLVLSLKCR